MQDSFLSNFLKFGENFKQSSVCSRKARVASEKDKLNSTPPIKPSMSDSKSSKLISNSHIEALPALKLYEIFRHYKIVENEDMLYLRYYYNVLDIYNY